MEFPQDRVVVVGCPSIDFALEATKRNINKIRFSGVGALPSAIIKKPFMIVAQHAETTSNVASREQIAATIQAVDKSQIGTIWIWPNPDRGGDEMLSEIRKARENGRLRNVHFEKSLSPEDFLCLINESSCIVGNSSVAVREGSFLGVPAVNIGTRQRERAIVQNARNVDFDVNEISFAISRQIAHGRFEPSDVYGSGGSGEKIARMIEKLI
jgi:UDP-N-acetylglucosamine 2-epimerase